MAKRIGGVEVLLSSMRRLGQDLEILADQSRPLPAEMMETALLMLRRQVEQVARDLAGTNALEEMFAELTLILMPDEGEGGHDVQ